jgi:rhamnose transport system permease protein
MSDPTPEQPTQMLRARLGIQPERFRELSLVLIILLTVLAFGLLVENLVSGTFFVRVTTGVAITATLAIAQTVIVVTRNIDLSVGSIVGVTAYLTGEYLAGHPGAGPIAAIALAMAIGCGMGLLNGTLVAYGRVPAIIVTIGTLAVYRTWLIEHANAQNITVDTLPDWLSDLSRTTVVGIGEFDIRFAFAMTVVVVLVLQLVLGRFRWGRWLYAVGSNPEAARQAGLPVQRVTLGAFALGGALAGLAGFMFLVRFGTITVYAGAGLELASVAAAVVGGVSVLGGTGTLVGALLGATLIDVLNQSLLRVPQVSEFWRDAILGALILAAVAGDFLLGKRLGRRWEPGSRRGASAQATPERGAIADA